MGSQRVGHDRATSLHSLLTELVKNLPAMQETPVKFLGWEDPLEKRSPGEGNGYPFQYSGLENSMECIVHGVVKNWTQLRDFHFHSDQREVIVYCSSDQHFSIDVEHFSICLLAIYMSSLKKISI